MSNSTLILFSTYSCAFSESIELCFWCTKCAISVEGGFRCIINRFGRLWSVKSKLYELTPCGVRTWLLESSLCSIRGGNCVWLVIS